MSQVEDVMLVMWKLFPLPQLISRLSGWMNEKQWIMKPWWADFPASVAGHTIGSPPPPVMRFLSWIGTLPPTKQVDVWKARRTLSS